MSGEALAPWPSAILEMRSTHHHAGKGGMRLLGGNYMTPGVASRPAAVVTNAEIYSAAQWNNSNPVGFQNVQISNHWRNLDFGVGVMCFERPSARCIDLQTNGARLWVPV
ncbi:predicted protein [Plenodomus lingam JN3]|uniref:Predicted protein n=1 Tax=Leptosphaeria maculans (strain JN3 / isolate v23.1.3 / race Av1-4-5-6-7-8) TaxID=985895 RepID=E5A3I7_LEPMJ|nr:predicted protein [Plenodomus lingam JN3]CBX98200.1 predicted protein [Plenodomus lingam JN3]